MGNKTQFIDELERRHGSSQFVNELRRRHGDGNTLYQEAGAREAPVIAKDVHDMSADFGVSTSSVEQYYPAIVDNDPTSIAIAPPIGYSDEPERQPQWEATPMSNWWRFKNFFKSGVTPLPPDAGRMEKLDHALDVAVSGPLRTTFKFLNGKSFGATELLWAGLKRITPKDVWDDDVKDMTFEEAIDWAMGYEPSGFQKVVGEIAEFSGRLSSARQLGIKTGLLGKLPKDVSVLMRAAEAGKLFGLAATADEISKLASTKIDPTETEYGFEGPRAVARDIAIGAALSVALSGVSAVWKKLAPTEISRALKLLGLKKGATDAEIRKAAQKLALKYHPDKVKGRIKDFREMIKARDLLKEGEVKDIVYRGAKVTLKPKLLAGEVGKPAVKPVTAPAKAPTVAPAAKPPAKAPIVPPAKAKEILGTIQARDSIILNPDFTPQESLGLGLETGLPDFIIGTKNATQDEIIAAALHETGHLEEGILDIFDSVNEKMGIELSAWQAAIEEGQKLGFTLTPELITKIQPRITKHIGLLEFAKAPIPPQEPRLGGKDAGATTILPDIVTETTEISKRLGSTSTKAASAVKKLIGRNVQRYTTHLRTLGDVGKGVANDLDQITQRAQVQINNSSLDTKDILKGVNKANRELIAKTINGKIDKPPKWIKERANKLRVVLDKLLNESQELGIQRLVRGIKVDIKGTGKAFPQIPNADGEKFLKLADAQGTGSSLVLDAAERAVATGEADSIEEYVSQLKEFRRAQLRGISGYLERTRVVLPEEFVEWDPDRILKGLFQKNWTFIEGVRQWGTDIKGQTFPKLDVKTEIMRAEHGADEAQVLERFIKAAFGRELLSSKEARAISGAIRGYQFLAKIALSPLTILRNMTDRFAKVSAWAPLSVQAKTFIQYPPLINTFLKHSRELEEEMIRRGAVFSNTAIAEGYQPGHLLTDLAGKAFSSSELGNQVYIALAKRNAIDFNLKLLRSNPAIEKVFNKRINKVLSGLVGRSETQAALRLRELGDDALIKKLQTSKDISPDLLNEVLHRTVRDNAFPVVASTKRSWWDNHPFIRVATQFKIWGTEQVGHIWNDVIKKTVQHRDPSLMIRWLITLATMGEIYNILRDFVLGRDESLLKTLSDKDRRNAKDISITILKDMADGGAVGILADLMYGLPNLIGGPSAQTLTNMGDATAKTIWNLKQAKDAIAQFAQKDTPAVKQAMGILDKIDAQYNKQNLTQDYYKVRRQTFEWRFEKEHPKGTDKAKERAIKALLGWTRSVPQERTLGYQMATRAILTGDTEAASEHLFFLLKTADTPTKQASIEQGIQSALRNASPLGHVAERDIGEFFESMSLGQQQKAMDIQLRWNENVAEAMVLAIDKWQRWSER